MDKHGVETFADAPLERLKAHVGHRGISRASGPRLRRVGPMQRADRDRIVAHGAPQHVEGAIVPIAVEKQRAVCLWVRLHRHYASRVSRLLRQHARGGAVASAELENHVVRTDKASNQ